MWNGWSFITRLGPLIKKELPNFRAEAPNEVENMDVHLHALQRWVGFGGFIFHTHSWLTHLCTVRKSSVGILAASYVSACQWSVLQNHGIIERFGLEGTFEGHLVYPPGIRQIPIQARFAFWRKCLQTSAWKPGWWITRSETRSAVSCVPCDQHGRGVCAKVDSLSPSSGISTWEGTLYHNKISPNLVLTYLIISWYHWIICN